MNFAIHCGFVTCVWHALTLLVIPTIGYPRSLRRCMYGNSWMSSCCCCSFVLCKSRVCSYSLFGCSRCGCVTPFKLQAKPNTLSTKILICVPTTGYPSFLCSTFRVIVSSSWSSSRIMSGNSRIIGYVCIVVVPWWVW